MTVFNEERVRAGVVMLRGRASLRSSEGVRFECLGLRAQLIDCLSPDQGAPCGDCGGRFSRWTRPIEWVRRIPNPRRHGV